MPRNTKQNRWAIAAFTIQNEGRAPFVIQIQGRKLWALDALVSAGADGCPSRHGWNVCRLHGAGGGAL